MRRFSQTAGHSRRLSRTTALLTATVLGLGLASCGEEVEKAGSFNAHECPDTVAPADASALSNTRWTTEKRSYHQREECPTQADADAFYASQADGGGGETPNPSRSPASPTRADGNSGSPDPGISTSSPGVPESPAIARERKVYRNSADFQFLDTDGTLAPGAKYIVDGSGGQGNCSFGWMVHPEGDNSRLLNLTAGHCGDVGDKIYSDYFGYASATPSVSMGSTQVEVKGWAGKDWLEENQPYMCRLGFRSGLSCGNFQQMTNDISMTYDAISDHGDSGGAVWAFDPSDSSQTSIYAVGVTSWLRYEDAATAGAKTVESVMNAQNLKIYAF
ncbi:MAG: S1 family peptidase [Corynebacterium sp.]|nr:S1 family peptidase [Corynebacterium sp.]